MGPCNVVLEGNTQMPRMRVRDCDFVIVDPGKGMKGVTGFENCNFIDCAFYRVTFFMTASTARDLKRQILETGKSDGPDPMNIISDGRYGSI